MKKLLISFFIVSFAFTGMTHAFSVSTDSISFDKDDKQSFVDNRRFEAIYTHLLEIVPVWK